MIIKDMIDEGYIKFETHWKPTAALKAPVLDELIVWRQKCYDLQLIGAYDNGIGYGNISVRKEGSNQFYISASATGNKPVLGREHFALVCKVDAKGNQLWGEGPLLASSESMSHAIVYEQLDWVQAVIHVHNKEMWQRLMHKVPTTDASAAYGSPEMAQSILDLIADTDVAEQKIFVMEGHEEGVFVFGKDLEEAFEVLMTYF